MYAKWSLVSAFCLMVVFSECFAQLTGGGYVERQLLCALDRGPCDRLGRQVKDSLPEIIGNQCRNCNAKQLANARRIAAFVQSKYPYVWEELVIKYSNNVNEQR